MIHRFLKFILLSAIAATTTVVDAATDYSSVLSATQSFLENRAFKNEDGVLLSFGLLHIRSAQMSEISVTLRMRSGDVSSFREKIWANGAQTFVDQYVDDQNIGSFLVSVEAPFHVLRIRPLNPGESDFISRECAFDTGKELHVCYFKMKHDHDVFVSTFWEIANP